MKKNLLILMVFLMFTGYSEETFEYRYSFISTDINKDFGNSLVVINYETTNRGENFYITLILKGDTFNLISHNKEIDNNYNIIHKIDENTYGIRSITKLEKSIILNINNNIYVLTNNESDTSRSYRIFNLDSNKPDITIILGVNESREISLDSLKEQYNKVYIIQEIEKDWVIYLRKIN